MIQQLLAAYGAAAAAGPLYLIDIQGGGGTTQAGYTAVTNVSSYSTIPGYGWSVLPAGTFDRAAAGGCVNTAFFRDGNYTFSSTTPGYMEFQFKVTPGSSVGVRVYCYDNSNDWGNVTITGDGGGSTMFLQGTASRGPASGTITLTDGDNDGVVTVRVTQNNGSGIGVCNGFDVAADVASLPAALT